MPLKPYQSDTLNILDRFLASSVSAGIEAAFRLTQSRQDGRIVDYAPVAEVPNVPFVCLKVPTGGGKTLLGGASISRFSRSLGQENPVVLWLVPTKTIRSQTLRQLRDPRSLIRAEIDPYLPQPTVLEISEALETGVAAYLGGPVIIVATLASFRVEEKEGRKVYESSGALMDHFENLPQELVSVPERDADGATSCSLANVLRLRRPIVIVDEAHKARTQLAFEVYARFAPSAILELTATPTIPKKNSKPGDPPPSNLLVDVAASRLKSEEVIKAPLELRLEPQWQKAITEALQKREELEQISIDPLHRPIVLVQCEAANGELNWKFVLDHLVNEDRVPREQIAVCTGEVDELPANLSTSPIRIVLTVDKLREGWDCPAAYVLCALRDLKSKTAIEQTLGRVMRQPNVRYTPVPALNRAYIYARGDRFSVGAAANEIVQALTELGFSKWEAHNTVIAPTPPLPFDQQEGDYGGLFEDPPPPSGPDRTRELKVPQLTIDYDGTREVASRDHFLFDLKLAKESVDLDEFDIRAESAGAIVDISKSGWKTASLDEAIAARALLDVPIKVTRERVVSWFDRSIPHPEVDIRQSLTWLGLVVDGLLASGMTLSQIWAERIRIRDHAAKLMRTHIKREFSRAAQGFLFDPPDEGLRVDAAFGHVFPERYDIPARYEGDFEYERHLYKEAIGPMNKEEAQFAFDLDRHENVDVWVRNVERVKGSFWLPTSSDRFYPDFVALLKDKRFAIYEWKSERDRENPDTLEKEKIGKVYEERSDGLCLFEVVSNLERASVIRELRRPYRQT